MKKFLVISAVVVLIGLLPAPGNATPMTYEWNGRQYVAIYSGGYARLDTVLSDRLIAFALPR